MNKSLYFFIIIAIGFILVLVSRFEQYKIEKNFLLFSTIECSGTDENCFVSDCSPDTEPQCDNTPYRKIALPAVKAPDCLYQHNCENFYCTHENECNVEACDQSTVDAGETCINM